MPLFLFFLWIGLATLQIILNDGVPSVVTRKYSQNEISNIKLDKIIAGQKIIFEFTANYNNLGYVSINFDMSGKGREDNIYVKIYEKDSGRIMKNEIVFAAAFEGLNFYPFGFPIESDSKSKTYIVEIESQLGSEKKHIAIKDAKIIFSASYQFDKKKIFSDFNYALDFAYIKTTNAIRNNFSLFTSTIYLYPFLFYLIWLFFQKYIKKKNLLQNPFFALIGIAVFTDIIFIDIPFDLVFLLISVIWGFLLFKYKKESADSYKAALALLILCPILQLLGQDAMVEKAAAWAFLALTVGVIINMYELRKSKTQSTN